ncbi:hypothetical protein HDU96_006119 [Phlyctochytrium bullatum]|nr:hypothetical protein HDU96_006119 [Phlyctochytrium bullatum]
MQIDFHKGTMVKVVVRGGEAYEGIFHTAGTQSDLGIVLKSAKLVGGKNGSVIQTLIIMPNDLISVSASAFESLGGFAEKHDNSTDTAISKASDGMRERELMPWSSDDVNSDLLLEDDKGERRWDQFSTNERLFGVTTDFQEEIYTTVIDRSVPEYKKKEAEAIRLAREMEAEMQMNPTFNPHLQEERNQASEETNMGEEEKYSSVVRTAGKYVPPGARGSNTQSGLLPRNGKPQAKQNASAPETGISDSRQHSEGGSQNSRGKVTASEVGKKAEGTPSEVAASPAVQRGSEERPVLKEETASARSGAAAKAVDVKEGKPSKGDLLNKLPIKVSQEPPSASLKDPLGEVAQAFGSFANQERRQLPTKLRDLMKKKEDVINDFKTFSTSFKLNTPIPADLAEMLKLGGKATSKSVDENDKTKAKHEKSETSAENRSTVGSPEKAVTKASPELSTGKSASASGETSEPPKFKLNVAAMEFTPLSATGSVTMNSNTPRTKSPGSDKQRPASVSGNPRTNSSRGSFGKGYQKGPQGGKQQSAGAAWNVTTQYRPPYPMPDYPEGVYMGGMEMSSQYVAYPMSTPYGQYPRIGMGPPVPLPAPPNGIPYVPYMQQYPPPLTPVPGYPQPIMGPAASPPIRMYQQGGQTIPPGGPAPTQTLPNGKQGVPNAATPSNGTVPMVNQTGTTYRPDGFAQPQPAGVRVTPFPPAAGVFHPGANPMVFAPAEYYPGQPMLWNPNGGFFNFLW